jgi:TonB family protein
MLRKYVPLLLALGALAPDLFAAGAKPDPAPADDILQLPPMAVGDGYTLTDFKLPTADELTQPEFSASDPFIKVQFPGQAVHEGVATGRATVGVLLDATGKPQDFLLLRYTRAYFGEALLEEAKRRDYSPKRLHGAPIPGSFVFSYAFEPPPGMNAISNFEAGARRAEEIQGGAGYVYRPVRETEIDGGQLAPTRLAVPVLPRELAPADGQPVRVLVSFYVDEQGRVRIPSTESTLRPEFITAAIASVQQWAFKPPTAQGRPVLVHAMRALTFRVAEGKGDAVKK